MVIDHNCPIEQPDGHIRQIFGIESLFGQALQTPTKIIGKPTERAATERQPGVISDHLVQGLAQQLEWVLRAIAGTVAVLNLGDFATGTQRHVGISRQDIVATGLCMRVTAV